MSNAAAVASAASLDPSQRRLAWGLLVSLLLHGLLLALHFGVPGLHAGGGSPLTVRLAPGLPVFDQVAPPVPPPLPHMPLPPAATQPILPPAPSTLPAPPLPVPPVPPVAAVPVPPADTAPRPVRHGFNLLDPVPAPVPVPIPAPVPSAPPPASTVTSRRSPRRRVRPQTPDDALSTRVIAQDTSTDNDFKLPPPAAETESGPDTIAGEQAPDAAVEAPPAVAAESDPREREEERARLAAQREREREARREADELAVLGAAETAARAEAERRSEALARQGAALEDELVRQQREEARQRVLAEQQAAEQQRERDEALARQEAERRLAQQAEQQRVEQLQREQAARVAEQQRVRELAEQQRMQQLAEQQRAQQLAEQQRAQQLAEQQRAQQLVEQQRAQQLAEQQARQQADQRAAEERARQQAEQLARRQAEEGARRLAQQAAQERAGRDGRPDTGPGAGDARIAADGGSGSGTGPGSGTLPRGDLGGGVMARAREALRGIDIGKPLPPALRPAEEAQRDLRRARADAASRDVPLRLYIDSVRQKIERNAIVGENLLAEGLVRTFPIVSVAIRSDGSIEDVTILRSSGRADIDDIVRRTVGLNARYAAFPPNVAAHYDVIELRRVWSFAGVLKLLEEMR